MKEKIIESAENEKIKLLKKLKRKKYRDQLDLFCSESPVVIYDALRSGEKHEALFLSRDLAESDNQKICRIKKDCAEFFLINEKLNKSFSALQTPSGICAIYKKRKQKINFRENIIYLNGISDPGNFGTILRTALAFNFKNIVLDEQCADLYNPKTVSAAREAIFKLSFAQDNNLELFQKIKTEMKIIATDISAEKNLEAINIPQRFCLVLGNESEGVNEKILKLSDKVLKIKTSEKINSLNVAVASGIILYRLENRRKLE